MANTPQDRRKAKNKTASSMQTQPGIQALEEDTGPIKEDDHHTRIAEYAFLMFAEDGFQHGHDLDHWLEAERRVIGH